MKIYSFEDPPEHIIQRISQIPMVIPKDHNEFEAAIKNCMRADPDVIMISEITDGKSSDSIEISDNINNELRLEEEENFILDTPSHFWTVEDPIEFSMEDIKNIEKEAVKNDSNKDPLIIIVGNVKDPKGKISKII